MVIHKLAGQRLFTLWFGWGLPLVRIAPLLAEKKSPESLSPERIRSHLYLDLWVLAFAIGLYALQPWLLPASVGRK